MPTPTAEANPSLALYWDFENLHASLCEAKQEGAYAKPDNRFKVQEPLVDVLAVMALVASMGPIAINRAYCNWQYFGRYRDVLMHSGMDLVQMFPPGGTAKNGADIRLCLDATEDVGRFSHISTVVVVGGRQRLYAAGTQDQGGRPATGRHWRTPLHQRLLGTQLPYVPLLR